MTSNDIAKPEIRALDASELEHVTGGIINCRWPFPRFPFPRLPNPVDVVVDVAKSVWKTVTSWF